MVVEWLCLAVGTRHLECVLGESFEETLAVSQIKPLWYFQPGFEHPLLKPHLQVSVSQMQKGPKRTCQMSRIFQTSSRHALVCSEIIRNPLFSVASFDTGHETPLLIGLLVACLLLAVRQIIHWQHFSLHQLSIGTTNAAGFHLKRETVCRWEMIRPSWLTLQKQQGLGWLKKKCCSFQNVDDQGTRPSKFDQDNYDLDNLGQ